MAIQSNFPAIKPSLSLDFANTKRLDSRVTFTRTTTATYYDGVTTAKAEENLLLYSQEFDNAAWTKQACAATANTTAAPDGTTTAETITLDVGAAVHAFLQSASSFSGGRTVSIFAKAGTHSFIQLSFNGDATPWANFTITAGAGAVGSTGTNQTASIVDVGNGWYRCVLYTASTTATNFYVTVVSSSTSVRQESWTAAGTETIYAWGAQLEQRSSVTAYTATTTQAITNYIPVLLTAASGVARFDHNPTTDESPWLLIEEARTNLLTYSADFSNAAWTKTSSTITANTVVSPDGALTGDKLIVDNGVAFGSGFTRQNVSKAASAITYTSTIYAKAGEFNRVRCLCRDSTTSANSASVTISLVDGSVVVAAAAAGTFTSASSSTTSVGNGWYRISLTFTSGTETAIWGGTYIPSDSVATQGDGYSGIYIWGAQLEAGAFPTSYIATTAATVTRNADVASMTGTNFTSWYNAGQGTLYADINPMALAAPNGVVINDNTTSNRIRLATTSVSDQGTVTVSGTAQATLDGGTPAANTNMKLAMTYQANNFALSLNGATAVTDTSGTVPVVSQLQIGSETTTVGNLRIKKIAYYPIASTATQLQALTS